MKTMCKRGVIFFMLVVLLLVLTCTSVSAATIADTNKTKLIEIPDNEGCSNFGAFCNNGNTAYALKTNSNDTKSTLYKIANFNDSSKAKIVSKKVISNLGHGNGMDYYDGKLWVTTCTKYLVRMSTDGTVEKRYTTPDGIKTNAISYCRDNKFLLTVGNDVNDAYTVFKVVQLDDTNNKIKYLKTFKIKAPTLKDGKYNRVTPQGFCYNSADKCLYMVYTQRKTGDQHSRYNWTFKVDLSGTIIDGHTYTPSKKFAIHADSSQSFFEAESWAMIGTAKYCGFNITENGRTADAIYKITNAN